MAGNPSLQTTYRQGTHQKVAFTGTAGTIANGFGAQTKTVRVIVTAAACVKIDLDDVSGTCCSCGGANRTLQRSVWSSITYLCR